MFLKNYTTIYIMQYLVLIMKKYENIKRLYVSFILQLNDLK